ncbi:MAG: hypothetical protein IPJ07_05270 [Acidobacteria bacterium]|nr:hypothetical protein [Acidobacteriota bacterium]
MITIGITDGVFAEINEGAFKEGDLVIIGQNVSTNSSSTANRPQTPPGFGGAPGGGPGGGARR